MNSRGVWYRGVRYRIENRRGASGSLPVASGDIRDCVGEETRGMLDLDEQTEVLREESPVREHALHCLQDEADILKTNL